MRRSLRGAAGVVLIGLAFFLGQAQSTAGQLYAGQVVSDIGFTEGRSGFTGQLELFDEFGSAIAALGDLDGDGVAELAVGACLDDDNESGQSFFNAGAVWILFLAQDGSVKSHTKISNTSGRLGIVLHANNHFGTALAPLGDLDGDGVRDLAVGAGNDGPNPGPDAGKGAVFILFLHADGTVKDVSKIADGVGGFTGPLGQFDGFGGALDVLGDLDGDGVVDLAVGAPQSDDGSSNRGSVWVLFLTADGTVKSQQKISSTSGGFTGTLHSADRFGTGVGGVADLDGDGTRDLCVGATGDEDGAAWILFMDPDGTVGSHAKIGAGLEGFPVELADGATFGSSVRALGDLDGDGLEEVAVGGYSDDVAGTNAGAVWVLFLGADGALHGMQKISANEGGFGGAEEDSGQFGASVCALGDFDGDGAADLGVGATDGSGAPGSAWLLLLRASPWVQLGHGLPGALGTPELDAGGTLLAGEELELTLSHARPSVATVLAAGTSAVFQPFKGGLFVPLPTVLIVGATDTQGGEHLAVRWPAGVPAGLRLWLQFWIADPTGAQGLTASNALVATSP